MRPGASRGLTSGERARLSPGLVAALDEAGISPVVLNRPHTAARIAALWRGSPPILARPGQIFWPGALVDYAEVPAPAFATLQHELQHLLDYATGAMTGLGYLLSPADWRYGYQPKENACSDDFGAEQRATIAEHLWLLEQGSGDLMGRALGREPPSLEWCRRVLPWA